MFVPGNDNFGSARERVAIFAARAAGLPGSFLGENNFAGAAFADSADDAAQHSDAVIVSRIECLIVREQKLDDEPEDERRADLLPRWSRKK